MINLSDLKEKFKAGGSIYVYHRSYHYSLEGDFEVVGMSKSAMRNNAGKIIRTNTFSIRFHNGTLITLDTKYGYVDYDAFKNQFHDETVRG